MKGSSQFRDWRRGRPFVGSLLLVLAGVETFFSTQLNLGNMHIQLGVEGFQATVIPIGFVLLGVLILTMPQHRIFYGVIALALSLYSIIGVNLGGFLIGMLLSAVGGILAVSWAPATADAVVDDAVMSSSPSVKGGGTVHAEFVPYPSLMARTRPAKADDTHAAPPPFSTVARTGASGSALERKAPKSSGSAKSRSSKSGSKSSSRTGAAAAAALLFLASITGIGAAVPSSASASPSSAVGEPSALCLPILGPCAAPSPSPSPSSGSGGGVGGGLVGGLLGGAAKVAPGAPAVAGPLVIGPDMGAYPMTLPAGQLGGSSIAISGIQQVGLVTVKKLDGTSFPVIKLVADDVTITGFSLDVRRAAGPSLVSTADRMELSGNVNVWLDSLTGTTLGGLGLTLGTDQTPPPGNELPSMLLRINLGLVATSANSITYSHLHQALHG